MFFENALRNQRTLGELRQLVNSHIGVVITQIFCADSYCQITAIFQIRKLHLQVSTHKHNTEIRIIMLFLSLKAEK